MKFSDADNRQRLTTKNALDRLSKHDQPFLTLFEHGTLDVEIYRPNKVDLQTTHSRDEIYVVVSGSGSFVIDGQTQEFEAGEVIFVPAGIDHRFVDFTADFLTWVFFYGPEGGEQVD